MSREIIDASGPLHNNWTMNATPPVIVNPEASIHSLVAWCWGEMCDLQTLACAHLADTGIESEELAGLFFHRLVAVVNVMEHLGCATRNATEVAA